MGITFKLEALEVGVLINNPNTYSADYIESVYIQRDTVEFIRVRDICYR